MFGFLRKKSNQSDNLNKISSNNRNEQIQNIKVNAVNNDINKVENKPLNILNLSKQESLDLLNLRKDLVSDMCSKKDELKDMTARVALVLDFSGSMSGRYRDGTVQAIIERIMPIANQFDDDGELDLWIFESGFKRLETININNFYGLAKSLLQKYRMGLTNYAPVMNDVISKYTVEDTSYLPAYVIFVTDGDNDDKQTTENLIRDTCTQPIFWQFVGIGNHSMSFLEKLDDMTGREIDSVDFFRLNNPNEVSDEFLYDKLFDEYPNWIRIVKNKGILK